MPIIGTPPGTPPPAPAPYATVAELQAFLSPNAAPAADEASRLLARASELLDRHITTAFAVDTGGNPTGTEHDYLRDACCAQVEFWMQVGGDEVDIEGIRGEVSIGGMIFPAPPELAPRARRLLERVGIISYSVAVA